MASILILTHEYDDFRATNYLIKTLFSSWRRAGHELRVSRGIPWGIKADIVIVHVDLSVVPAEFGRFAAQYPVQVNSGATDIRKRAISRNLLQQGDKWDGPVIVKSDLNYFGKRELRHNMKALEGNRPLPYPTLKEVAPYQICASASAVPLAIWADPRCVVERFLPERDEKGYWLRCWVFFGDAERCNRFCCPDPIVKGSNLIAREPVPVPNELRIERKRLGFDYGKFDFVVHEGRVVLLDANRTPTAAANLSEYQDTEASRLASGIESFLRTSRGG
jgi:hypothetical protein